MPLKQAVDARAEEPPGGEGWTSAAVDERCPLVLLGRGPPLYHGWGRCVVQTEAVVP